MAVTINLLGSSVNTLTTPKTVVATPTAGATIIVIGFFSDPSSAITAGMMSDDNTGAGTYGIVNGCLNNASANELEVMVRSASVNAVSTTFTFDPGVVTITGGGLIVLEVVGLSRFGAAAIRQSANQNNQAGGGTPTPVLGAAALTSNGLIGAVMNLTNPATITPRAAWSEVVDSGYATPTTGIEVMTINSGEIASSIAWGGTSGTNFGSVVIELNGFIGGNQVLIF